MSEATAFVDRRCGDKWCADKGVYRMIGGCYNCRTEPLLGLFTVTHEARGGDCPACGCTRLHWDRLAAPDEIPADFEAKPQSSPQTTPENPGGPSARAD